MIATEPVTAPDIPQSPDALPLRWVVYLDDEAPDPPVPEVDPRLGPRLARRRARVEAQRADLEATYRAEVDSLTLWRDAQAARLQREADRLDLGLYGLLAWEQERDPKRKSMAMPFGVTVKTRKVPGRISRDTSARATAALVAWAETTVPDCVEREPVLRWTRLQERLQVRVTEGGALVGTEDGEAPPAEAGVQWVPEYVSRSVVVDRQGGA